MLPLLPCGRPTTWRAGWGLAGIWRDFRGSVVGGLSRCEELFWEARWGRRRGFLFLIGWDSLVCLFPAPTTYYYYLPTTTNLYHNLSRRLLSVCIIVLIVWWFGAKQQEHQWNVRENNMGGLGTHQTETWNWIVYGQILFPKFRTISNN